MINSIRTITKTMDPLAEAQPRLSSILSGHRWLSDTPALGRGLREVVRRHNDGIFLKFLSYNTYLTEFRIKLPDPFSDIEIAAKPALKARAVELGRVLKDAQRGYDVASLYEVMQEEARDEILGAWGASPPAHHFGGVLTSVMTVSKTYPIGTRLPDAKTFLEFNTKGKEFIINPFVGKRFGVSLDADYYAHKGVLLTEIVTPLGTIEVYSTHLMFGGGLGSAAKTAINAATPSGDHISPSTPDERLALQMMQLQELKAFYSNCHAKGNVAILCGDFNIDGSDDKNAYPRLTDSLSEIGMKDAWAAAPYKEDLHYGQTARNDDGDDKPTESDFSQVCVPLDKANDYCDESKRTRSGSLSVGRFDYIFVEEPRAEHTFNLDLTRLSRRLFRRPIVTDNQGFLSDHLGLETTFIISKK